MDSVLIATIIEIIFRVTITETCIFLPIPGRRNCKHCYFPDFGASARGPAATRGNLRDSSLFLTPWRYLIGENKSVTSCIWVTSTVCSGSIHAGFSNFIQTEVCSPTPCTSTIVLARIILTNSAPVVGFLIFTMIRFVIRQ